jgi:hypothetical protein
MSDAQNKAPALEAFTVRDNGEEKGFFIRIGAAWPIKDGTGFSLQLDALPVNGRIVLLPKKAKADSPAE